MKSKTLIQRAAPSARWILALAVICWAPIAFLLVKCVEG